MKFLLRSWAEQTLFDCQDYEVEADSLEAAAELLAEQQEMADSEGGGIEHASIRNAFRNAYRGFDTITPLDPNDIAEGGCGITLIDARGNRVRDLVGVPTGCVQLGEPLEGPAVDVDQIAAAAPALLAALVAMLSHPRPAESSATDSPEQWTMRYRNYEAAWDQARAAVKRAGVVL